MRRQRIRERVRPNRIRIELNCGSSEKTIVTLRFSKMHGLGNDFVVLDCRTRPLTMSRSEISRMGDRHTGVGFDQLKTIEPATDASCAFRYGIYNRDGSQAGQCGNGVRCVAAWLARAGALPPGLVRLQSPSGAVSVELLNATQVRVDMGVPNFSPAAIPLRVAQEASSYSLQVGADRFAFGAVSMGNPHAVLEVDDCMQTPVLAIGPRIELSDLFPQSCNVGFAQIIDRGHVRLRVWERGVGETLACGSGACAAVAVLARQDKLDAHVRVALPGGALDISWEGAGHSVWMSGPAAFAFEGEWLA